MIDYEIALCDVAEVMRRHNKAQLGGCVLTSDVAVERIRNIVTPHGQWIVTQPNKEHPHEFHRECSVCGDARYIDDGDYSIYDAYCPVCGARMLSETEKSHIEAEIGRINSYKEDPENVPR